MARIGTVATNDRRVLLNRFADGLAHS